MKLARTIITGIIIFTFCILMFSSCDEGGLLNFPKKEPEPVAYPGAYSLDISFGDFKAKAELTYESHGFMRMVFSEPKSIEGFCIKLENMVYSYEINNNETSHTKTNVPANAVPTMVFSVLQTLLKKEYIAANLQDNVWLYEGFTGESMFIAKQDADTALLNEIDIPEQDFKAILSCEK